EGFRQGSQHTEVACQAQRRGPRGSAFFGGVTAQALAVAVGRFGGQRTNQKPGWDRDFVGKGDIYSCPSIPDVGSFQGLVQIPKLPLRVVQSNILPVHAQQNISSGFANRMDASGMRQSSVPTDNVSRLRPISLQSLTPLVIGDFHPSETTLRRIIDDMQTPIGSFTARDAQHRSVIDPKLWPRGSFGFQSV